MPSEFDKFNDHLIAKTDEVHNLAFELLSALSTPIVDAPVDDTKWDMEQIGDLVECAEKILNDHNVTACYPYYELQGDDELSTDPEGFDTVDGIPCPVGTSCKRTDCPFKKQTETAE